MKFILKTDVCDLIWECQTLETSILAVTVWTLKERLFTKDDAQASLEIVSLENACGGEQISLFWHNSNRYDEVLRARHRVTNGCDGWHVSGQVQQAAVRLPDERGPHTVTFQAPGITASIYHFVNMRKCNRQHGEWAASIIITTRSQRPGRLKAFLCEFPMAAQVSSPAPKICTLQSSGGSKLPLSGSVRVIGGWVACPGCVYSSGDNTA